MTYSPGNFDNVRDPVARAELRKLWDTVQRQRTGDDRIATVDEYATLRRRILAIRQTSLGYRATTTPGDDMAAQAEIVSTPVAPIDAPYVLMDHDIALPNHRRLQAGTSVILDDSGPAGNATLRLDAAATLAGRVQRFTVPKAFGSALQDNFGMAWSGSGATASAGPTATRLGQMVRFLHGVASVNGIAFLHGQIGSYRWLYRGNATGLGGFHFRHCFGVETVGPTMRWFCGVRASSTQTSAGTDFSTLTNCVLFGSTPSVVAPSGYVYLYHNDGSGTATVINTDLFWAQGDIFQMDILCDANADSMVASLIRTTEAGVTSSFVSDLTTNLPDAATFMNPNCQVNNTTPASLSQLAYMYSGVDQPYGL